MMMNKWTARELLVLDRPKPGSQWISHGCMARYSAEAILLDRPFRKSKSSFRLTKIVACAVALFIGAPIPTSAAEAKSIQKRVLQPIEPGRLDQLQPFDTWLPEQAEISYTKLLANISPPDAARGVVIASLSRRDPDYYFHWIRDAALVMSVIGKDYALSSGMAKDRWFELMDEYIEFSKANQTTWTLTGLGEPKFHVDGRSFEGPWGRPQNDGPALRALTLSRFAQLLIKEGNRSYVRMKLYQGVIPATTLIKKDLEYVAHHWRETSFDLWEEVRGDHFYTRLVQMASLNEGADLADEMGDTGGAKFYRQQALLIRSELAKHWDEERGIFRVTLNRVEGIEKESGLDVAIVLGVLHAGLPSGDFSVTDDRVLATAERLEAAFQTEYAINAVGRFKDVGTAIGRYPGDQYSGQPQIYLGNPWVLSTAGFGEFYYKLAAEVRSAKQFQINGTNLRFVQSLLGTKLAGKKVIAGMVIKRGSLEMRQLTTALLEKGDLFLKRVRLHKNADGSLAEQIDRQNGFMVSARDLTWSYASVITAYWARP